MSKNSVPLAVFFALVTVALSRAADYPKIYTNTWLVKVHNHGRDYVDQMAKRHGFVNMGPAGSIEGCYIFEHRAVRRSRRSNGYYGERLRREPLVQEATQQHVLKRVKRDLFFSDPLYKKQWYLYNTGQTPGPAGYDINVCPVWKKNITGKGVVVTILDDGIEYTHPDLRRSYDPKASYDFNNNDADPTPRYTDDNINKHGTRCAGEIAGDINNGVCGVGVAYDAKVGGVRMLDGDVTDAIEGSSLSLQQTYIDIYSSSWGPDDDGKTVDGPGKYAQEAFRDGIKKGRGGLGAIFVWATGNGGGFQDYCNCDGYITSIYTVSIGAVSDMGVSPWYAENCPSTLAVTYSSGAQKGRDLKIFTTDLHKKCTDSHTGTSAAAPLAAGIFALVLQANNMLTWRDLQHSIVMTSKLTDREDSDWRINGAGLHVNHKYGFGVLDTAALIDYVTKPDWKTLKDQHMCEEMGHQGDILVPGGGTVHTSLYSVGCILGSDCVTSLEHVRVYVTLSHARRGSLIIKLTSPAQTVSKLLDLRVHDMSSAGFRNWAFMTVFNWGESPHGEWKLSIINTDRSMGRLRKWSLKFYGTCEKTKNITSNESRVCAKECIQDCKSEMFHRECGPSCQLYCDCAIGKCVPDCSVNGSDKDEDRRLCKRPAVLNPSIENGFPGLFSSQTKWLIMVAAFMATIILIGGIWFVYLQNRNRKATRQCRVSYVPAVSTENLEELGNLLSPGGQAPDSPTM